MIVGTKENKELSSITAAKNAITILVAAKESFSGKDLRNINIKGANIRDGIFHKTDFTGADLTNVDMTNVNITEAKFKRVYVNTF